MHAAKLEGTASYVLRCAVPCCAVRLMQEGNMGAVKLEGFAC